jgi:hypothetical protein
MTSTVICLWITFVDKLDEKNKRRKSRARNLAQKDSPYSKKGHSHKSPRDYSRVEKYPIYYDSVE